MANSSIYAAFERMWQHTTDALENKSNTDHNHDGVYATENYVDEAIASAGSETALQKTGDTMEGILKFTPDIHYGASLPEAGEAGQIFFVEAEEAFLENKDGVIKTNNVENKAITRAKLSEDVFSSFAPPYIYSTTDLTAGTSELATGKLYLVYE